MAFNRLYLTQTGMILKKFITYSQILAKHHSANAVCPNKTASIAKLSAINQPKS